VHGGRQRHGGAKTDVTSVEIPGDAVEVRLVADSSQQAFGYHVDRVDVMGFLAGTPDAAPGTSDAGSGDAGSGGDDSGGCGSNAGRAPHGPGALLASVLSLLAIGGAVRARRRRRQILPASGR
jgi:hypothetical protein